MHLSGILGWEGIPTEACNIVIIVPVQNEAAGLSVTVVLLHRFNVIRARAVNQRS